MPHDVSGDRDRAATPVCYEMHCVRGPVDHQHILFGQRYFMLAPGLTCVVDLVIGENEIKARFSSRMARGSRAQRRPLSVWLPAASASYESLLRVCLSSPGSLLLFQRSRQTAHVTSIRTRTGDRSRHRRDVYLGLPAILAVVA